MMFKKSSQTLNIPLNYVGPAKISFPDQSVEEVSFPLATYETPLWPSVGRGARVSQALPEGIRVRMHGSCMTRSVLLEGHEPGLVEKIQQDPKLQEIAASTSRYTRLLSVHAEVVGPLLFLRFSFETGQASGHNMATKAAEALLYYLLDTYPVSYVSISGNLCTDKKVSAINGILGRGKSCMAEAIIPANLCRTMLKTDPKTLYQLNQKKNYIGSILAGSLRSANAHYANMLLAFYLATGQDAANIVEGSQGITYVDMSMDDLYFSVNLPNIIVGSIGNGKHDNPHLLAIGCQNDADRLALLMAACVWCGELSLLAAQTHPSELMRAHTAYER